MFLRISGIVVLLCLAALPARAQVAATRPATRVLFLTKSGVFQHPVITRDEKDRTKLALAERILVELGAKHGYEVTATKDAAVFDDPATLARYDVFVFYTTGDLTKPTVGRVAKLDEGGRPMLDAKGKPVTEGIQREDERGMSAKAKAAFLQAIAEGKGFVGIHCATDTFHSKKNELLVRPADAKDAEVDPYIRMIGGEFASHGSEQKARMGVADKAFGGLAGLEDFVLEEEWYSLKNLAPDLRVILVQDTASMPRREKHYERPPYPATWARMHGKGRVFYTSMGHREEVWTNPLFQRVLLGGLDWAAGRTQADLTPNMEKVCPQPAGNK